MSRLAKARDNLTRIADLAGELRPQVRRLALQAKHQQEHDSLLGRARALVVASHRRREAAARSAVGEARRRAAAAEAELEALRSEQAAGREAATAAEERYWRAEEAARAAAEQREATREARIRAESRLESIEGRLADLRRAEEAASAELATVRAALAELGSGAVDAQVEPARADADAAESEWRRASGALAEADSELLAAEAALAEARRDEATRIAFEARRDEVATRLDARRQELTRELEEARTAIHDAEAALGPARRDADVARQAAETARGAEDAARRHVAEAQPRADAARRAASELAERVGAMRGELEALHERAEHGARLGSLLTAAGWSSVLDSLQAPEEAWTAIEAAIGGELEHALVWRDGDLVGRLAEARGAARLLAEADGRVDEDAERAAALRAVGAERTLADWIGGSNAGLRLFTRTVVAPDLRALLAGWTRLPAGWLAVTPRGDVADGRGVVAVRGHAEEGGGEAVRRHARRRELADALDKLEVEQSSAAAEAARAMATVGEASRAADLARETTEAAETRLRAAVTVMDELEARYGRASAAMAAITEELDRLSAAEPPEPVEAPDAAGVDLRALERRAAGAGETRRLASEALEVARQAWLATQSAARSHEERQLGQRRERESLGARAGQLEAAAQSRAAEVEGLLAEREAAEEAVAAARADDEAAAARRKDAEQGRQAARGELLELERRAGDGGGRLAELERTAHAASIEASRHEEALAALARERELALDTLPAPAEESAPDPDEGPPDDLDELDDDALETELRRVRRTLAQIGSVNPFAVEEHAELAARLEELSTQESDLTAAIGSTEELIARLDAQITEQFSAAFEAIGERFDEFCRLLFAGGSASLSIADGSDGEAPGGIEIVVRPPGKRLQRLAMLSGGERALTGVALLFAMLSVNPVPFCILDEVDAALDEANIGRFADALRKLAETIDFVVITHNRATIEVADTIYGVTMTDAAVSRVVSLRLADLPAEVTA
jgi:chromosome segregation protein